jgi:predicted transcriptional regulator
MPESITRDRIIESLRQMPADATLDDAIERLVFLAKIEAGLSELDAGKGIPHEEVKQRLGL